MLSNYVIWASFLDDGKHYGVLEELDNVDDDFELKKGIPRAFTFPDDAEYSMDPAYPKNVVLADNLYNIDRLIVGSVDLKKFLEERQLANVEYLPVSILDHKNCVASRDYFLIHPIHPQDCLDVEASGVTWSDFLDDEIDEIERLVIDESAIPPEIHLFRLKSFLDPILVRRDIADAIIDEGFTGIRWIELEKYPEL